MTRESVAKLFIDLPEGARDEILIIGLYFVNHTALVDLNISQKLTERLAYLTNLNSGLNYRVRDNGMWRNDNALTRGNS